MSQKVSEVEDWSRALSKMIGATEARVASYKKLVGEAYKQGDRELIELFKGYRQDEEKWLKKLRWEKTCLNAGMWEQCFRNPEGGQL